MDEACKRGFEIDAEILAEEKREAAKKRRAKSRKARKDALESLGLSWNRGEGKWE